FYNDGTITVQGNNAVAISGGITGYAANLVNSGTINVGTEVGKTNGTNGTNLVGIKGNGVNTTINNAADGVINIYADSSYAFGGTTKQIINNGEVNLRCDTGCAISAPGTVGTITTGTVVDLTVPASKVAPTQGSVPKAPADTTLVLQNYVVGTNADGSAGSLTASNMMLDSVQIDTGFTAGTAAKTGTFDNVFKGSDIQGAENIQSDTVVWKAQGQTDASGNVDVTMTKNSYQDVADASVSNVAGALEAGYTNNALYQSLNLKTVADVTHAIKQISGVNATSAFNEARVLSNRFSMLADSAVVTASGLGFNVVAKGDQRAELGNNTRYDMMALSKAFSLSPDQNMTLKYGIARLDGNGDVKNGGDNGLTGGYSQFFGLEHSLALNENYSLNTALRYDNQQLDSSRSIQYGGVNEVADSSNSQQYMELKTGVGRGFALSDTLSFKPSVGMKLRHTVEGGVNETGANDFNLNMGSSTESAVDAVIGMQLDYAGQNGWSASAKLEGGPNLSYSKSQHSAELQGAAGQRFSVDDGQKGGGVNGLAQIGVHYNQGNTTMGLDAYNWREDSASDKGLNMNV
ncbi:autotransporter outer membrane beta-barrel domain-containing protein, partial [Budvicia diplopodorum]|uniref:autotransporter outer membrane beta-barrel domain-containing protein n=1 Tax=Budvicia diplopodorum TaxID=1119056 RepID=UPI00135A9B6A